VIFVQTYCSLQSDLIDSATGLELEIDLDNRTIVGARPFVERDDGVQMCKPIPVEWLIGTLGKLWEPFREGAIEHARKLT